MTYDKKLNKPIDVTDEGDFQFNTEDMSLKVTEYNANIKTLDEAYTALNPVSDVLVRVYLKEFKTTESGLFKPNLELVNIPTSSGVGHFEQIESPWPYSTKAVIVAAPKVYSVSNEFRDALTPGLDVILGNNPIKATVLGGGQSASINIPRAFQHPDLMESMMSPTDPTDRNYGYLLVSYNDLKFIG